MPYNVVGAGGWLGSCASADRAATDFPGLKAGIVIRQYVHWLQELAKPVTLVWKA